MPRPYRVAQRIHPLQKSSRPKIAGKDLDLLLLAGCSCLLTLLYHPVADAIQAQTASRQTQPNMSAQPNAQNLQSAQFHLTKPPEREELSVEDENA